MKRFLVPTLTTLAVAGLALFCDQTPTDVPPPPLVPSYTLDSNEVVRLIYPNGGEGFLYGDTIRVKWLARYRALSQVTIAYVNNEDGTSGAGIGLHNSENDWIKLERDIPSGPHGSSVTMVNTRDSIVLVSYPVILKDSTYAKGSTRFKGRGTFRVYHPAPEINGQCAPACELLKNGDASDGSFTIISVPDSLDNLEPVRMLYPNGGDSLNYGDTITVRWIADAALMDQMALSYVGATDGTFGYGHSIQNAEPDWTVLPRDIPKGPNNSTVSIVNQAKGIVLVEFPVVIKDSTYQDPVFMRGRGKFKVHNPYPGSCEPCEDGDASDDYFTIIR